MAEKADTRRKSSSSLLTRCLLEEYARLENEAAACKTLYEKAYVGAYGSKDAAHLTQNLRDVLPRDSTVDLFSPRRREICQVFLSFFGWVCSRGWRRHEESPSDGYLAWVRPRPYCCGRIETRWIFNNVHKLQQHGAQLRCFLELNSCFISSRFIQEREHWHCFVKSPCKLCGGV